MTATAIRAVKGTGLMVATKPTTFHGFDVLELHAGDDLPAPRAPRTWAVYIHPDLARDMLARRNPRNRNLKTNKVKAYAADMDAGLWKLTWERLAFDDKGILMNGQNRLMAVTEHGKPVWFLVEFGWSEELMDVVDRGARRTNADGLRIHGIPNATTLAAAIAKYRNWALTVGTDRAWSGVLPPSSGYAERLYADSPDAWDEAVHWGGRMYLALDKSLSASIWAAAFRILADDGGSDQAAAFFEEVKEGQGKPRSASRELREWFIRRPVTATHTGDNREPIELIIRAFNAWAIGRSFSKVRHPGFVLSRVRRTVTA